MASRRVGGCESARTTARRYEARSLTLAEDQLLRPAPLVGGVIWLEYLQADLHWPPTLSLGPAVTLYQDKFLRPTVHQNPSDERIPEELRDQDSREMLLSWLHAYDPAEAVRADYEFPGDPRVYLRLVLNAMPPGELLRTARETAEFLPAFGGLAGDNHELWILGDGYHVPGFMSSTAAMTVNTDTAREQLRFDATAVHLARQADALGRHLPLNTPELRLAGRLLVWLRQTGATDNPAQVVLCDRVFEQVSGWAGISELRRFTSDWLKPAWVYNQILNAIRSGYDAFRNATHWQHPLQDRIETRTSEPDHSPGNWLGGINLKAVLTNLDDLIGSAPEGSDAAIDLTRLRDPTTDGAATRAWLAAIPLT
jgi:hypothetical protein